MFAFNPLQPVTDAMLGLLNAIHGIIPSYGLDMILLALVGATLPTVIRGGDSYDPGLVPTLEVGVSRAIAASCMALSKMQ